MDDSQDSAETAGGNNNESNATDKEDCTGFNSEDEYDDQGMIKKRHLPDEEWQKVYYIYDDFYHINNIINT